MPKTDIQIKQDIEAELGWDPKVNAARVAVAVDHGSVALLGTVDSYAEKWAAEAAVKRVGGVRAVAQELSVKVLIDHMHGDAEIAEAIARTFEWVVTIPEGVTAQVVDGVVTLAGEVDWNFQRDAAEQAIGALAGVNAVHNGITLAHHSPAATIEHDVLAALRRQNTSDSTTIHVATAGGRVTLTGQASSWAAIDAAASAAWAAPGVTDVVDRLTLATTA